MNIRKILVTPLVKALTLSLTRLDPEGIYGRQGYKELYRLLGAGGISEAGINVSADNALQNSVVWACVRFIAQTYAYFPLNYMQDTGDGKKRIAKDDPLHRIMHYTPNPMMTSMEMREVMTAHLLLRGNAYARIVRRSNSGEVLGMYPLNPDTVTPKIRDDKTLFYEVKEKGEAVAYEPRDMFHVRGLGFDGISGYGVIELARNAIGLSEVQQKYVSKFFAQGGRRPYILEYPTKMKDTEFETFQARWKAAYGSVDRMHEAPITEGGLKYTELGFSPRDAQFLEGRQYSVAEICRWFNLSPIFVQDLTHATFSNVEHLGIYLVTLTMAPWCKRWEEALWRCLLTEREQKQGYYFNHVMNALQRGDYESRMRGYSTALQNGIMNPNEVRALEDMPPFDGGDDYHIQLNMQTVNADGQATASQAAALVKVGSSKGGNNGTQAS
jgi:HK97 family phage portal protein